MGVAILLYPEKSEDRRQKSEDYFLKPIRGLTDPRSVNLLTSDFGLLTQ
jgi:hypothetical protein